MKSVFVESRSYFDKSGGNSYFSARVSVNGKVVAVLPFQYGYGNQYEYEAMRVLADLELIPIEYATRPIWKLEELGADVYLTNAYWNKSDVKRFGEAVV